VLQKIDELNNDKLCVGIVVQLPLADNLKPYKAQILSKVDISKDLDGLGGKLFGLSSIDLIDFLPATPM
jgi:5,10-methylene-tetrahydrofolate dehydrogenase/methenyl tetrahydrofolate cyclohydrolase